MFSQWLAPRDLTWFMEKHFQRAPLANPGAAASATALLDWDTVVRVLQSGLPLDVLTVARGRLVEAVAPRTLSDVHRLVHAGVSVVIRSSELHDPGLGALAESFRQALPGEVHVQIYVTPAGTNSYGWHYDFEDVFIAQAAGVKDYYFRANTTAQDAVLGDWLDFSLIRRENTPLMTAQLLADDWLYLPARWWHLVQSRETSLSISVGVMSPAAFRSAKHIPAGWSGDERISAESRLTSGSD